MEKGKINHQLIKFSAKEDPCEITPIEELLHEDNIVAMTEDVRSISEREEMVLFQSQVHLPL